MEIDRREAAGPAPSRARILVIDDEPLMGETLTLALRNTHEVVVASSGASGLAILQRDADFDLVLCDLMMPDVSGEAVYRRAMAARPELEDRFVFITGGAYTVEAEAFLSQTGLRRLEKPFRIHDVEALLEAAPESQKIHH